MSADAKVWQNDEDGWDWRGLHDGTCEHNIPHAQGSGLSELIQDIETCMGQQLRWVVKEYPDNQFGLSGYVA